MLSSTTATATTVSRPGPAAGSTWQPVQGQCRSPAPAGSACAAQGLLRGIRAVLHLRHPPARPQPPPESAGRTPAWCHPARRQLHFLPSQRTGPAGRPGSTAKQYIRSVDAIELPAGIADRLAALHRQREENSRNFFRDNAHKFRQQQDLIASYEQYAETVAQVLRDAPLPDRHTALEVGPGDGSFLLELAPGSSAWWRWTTPRACWNRLAKRRNSRLTEY